MGPERYNVLDYGLLPTDSTTLSTMTANEKEAFLEALMKANVPAFNNLMLIVEAAGGGEVFFPAGDYYFNDQLGATLASGYQGIPFATWVHGVTDMAQSLPHQSSRLIWRGLTAGKDGFLGVKDTTGNRGWGSRISHLELVLQDSNGHGTPSIALCTLTFDPGAPYPFTLPKGSRVTIYDDFTGIWLLQQDWTITGPTMNNVPFVSQETGFYPASAGRINTIIDTDSRWLTVSNVTDFSDPRVPPAAPAQLGVHGAAAIDLIGAAHFRVDHVRMQGPWRYALVADNTETCVFEQIICDNAEPLVYDPALPTSDLVLHAANRDPSIGIWYASGIYHAKGWPDPNGALNRSHLSDCEFNSTIGLWVIGTAGHTFENNNFNNTPGFLGIGTSIRISGRIIDGLIASRFVNNYSETKPNIGIVTVTASHPEAAITFENNYLITNGPAVPVFHFLSASPCGLWVIKNNWTKSGGPLIAGYAKPAGFGAPYGFGPAGTRIGSFDISNNLSTNSSIFHPSDTNNDIVAYGNIENSGPWKGMTVGFTGKPVAIFDSMIRDVGQPLLRTRNSSDGAVLTDIATFSKDVKTVTDVQNLVGPTALYSQFPRIRQVMHNVAKGASAQVCTFAIPDGTFIRAEMLVIGYDRAGLATYCRFRQEQFFHRPTWGSLTPLTEKPLQLDPPITTDDGFPAPTFDVTSNQLSISFAGHRDLTTNWMFFAEYEVMSR
jgi:hypothetical protein